MKILLWENELIRVYDVKDNNKELDSFLEYVVNKHGFIRTEEIKSKALTYKAIEKKYCHEAKNLKILKVFEDKTKVHKGRKRVERKQQNKKYLYSFTAIDMPEICHTIASLFGQKYVDLRIFDKYLFPREIVDYQDLEYYLEEGYQSYDKEGLVKLRKSLIDEDARKKYIDEIIVKRRDQAEVLPAFFKTLTFEPADNVVVFYNEEEKRRYTTLSSLLNLPKKIGVYYDLGLSLDYETIDATPENILIAQTNTEIMSRLGVKITPSVKCLNTPK